MRICCRDKCPKDKPYTLTRDGRPNVIQSSKCLLRFCRGTGLPSCGRGDSTTTDMVILLKDCYNFRIIYWHNTTLYLYYKKQYLLPSLFIYHKNKIYLATIVKNNSKPVKLITLQGKSVYKFFLKS